MTANKKLAAMTLIPLVLIAAGAVAYFAIAKDGPENNDTATNDQNDIPIPPAPDVPEGPAQPEDQPATENQAPTDDATEPPEGTLSPHAVSTGLDAYFDQDLRLYGLIVQTSADGYSILSQNPDEDQGIRLVPAENVDIAQHASEVTVVNGKLVVLDDGTVAFEVKSIE